MVVFPPQLAFLWLLMPYPLLFLLLSLLILLSKPIWLLFTMLVALLRVTTALLSHSDLCCSEKKNLSVMAMMIMEVVLEVRRCKREKPVLAFFSDSYSELEIIYVSISISGPLFLSYLTLYTSYFNHWLLPWEKYKLSWSKKTILLYLKVITILLHVLVTRELIAQSWCPHKVIMPIIH